MNSLSIRHLKKTYASGLTALKGIDLEVEEGDFFALLGPNGAGKTTTIGIITSLVTKTAGEVYIGGHNLDTDTEKAKALIGVVPQEFNFSVFEKVIDIVVNQAGFYGIRRAEALEKATHYLTQLGLWEKRYQQARSLSGGMKRRLMIARALVHDPKILILDEPTAGVDIEARRAMWQFLQTINQQGKTIILTTHYLEEAESLCRKVAIIHEGNIVENTTVKQLLSRLTTETFVLDLKEPLAALPRIKGFELKLLDQKTIEINFEKSISLNDIFLELSQQKILVTSMRNKTNRLEELFLRLTKHEVAT